MVSIARMCELGGVSRAGFYRDWQTHQPAEAELALRDSIQQIALSHRRLGYRRITVHLQNEGIAVGERVVRRILKTDNLLAIGKRKFVATTDSAHGFAVYPNLARYVKLNDINQLWVADLTYVRLRQEFIYVAVVLDVYSRRVVGWALGRSLQTDLPLQALERALASRNPPPGLVHHSDRGTQYASNEYVKRLESAGMYISMSRPARPWENAHCESFMRTLKEEQIAYKSCSTLEELEQSIASFIDGYYNVSRLHSALDYRSPDQFEQALRAAAPTSAPITRHALSLSFPRHQEIYPDA